MGYRTGRPGNPGTPPSRRAILLHAWIDVPYSVRGRSAVVLKSILSPVVFVPR
jgi:hypothetical protein